MPSLTFEGETHGELVEQVRRWLASVEGEEVATLTAAEAVAQGAEITKDALRILASAAPGSMAGSEVVQALTSMGYQATDATRDAVLAGLDSLDQATGGNLVKKVGDARNRAAYEMNVAVAKQLFRSVAGR